MGAFSSSVASAAALWTCCAGPVRARLVDAPNAVALGHQLTHVVDSIPKFGRRVRLVSEDRICAIGVEVVLARLTNAS
jgi:hypothetical protein